MGASPWALFATVFCGALLLRTAYDGTFTSDRESSQYLLVQNPPARRLSSSLPFACVRGSSASSFSSSSVSGVRSMYRTLQPNGNFLVALLDAALNSPSTQTATAAVPMIDYVKTLLYVSGTFFAIGFLSIFGWCSYCCFTGCCKKVKADNDDEFDKLQEKACYVRGPIVVCMVSAVFIIALSCLGLAYESDMNQSVEDVQCSLVYTFDDVLNGNIPDSPWPGIDQFNVLLTNISTQAAVAGPVMTDVLANATFVTTGYAGIVNALYALQAAVNSTSTFSFDYSGTDTPMTRSCALCTSINSDMSTVISEVDGKLLNASNAMKDAREFGLSNIAGAVSTIQSSVSSAQSISSSAKDALSGSRDEMVDYLNLANEYAFQYRRYAFVPLLAIFLYLGTITVIALFGHAIYKVNRMRVFMNCSWCWGSFMLILACLCTGVYLIVSLIATDVCGLFSTVISPTGLSVYATFINSGVSTDVASRCLFGDGDLVSALNLNSSLYFGPSMTSDLDYITTSPVSSSSFSFSSYTSLANQINTATPATFGASDSDITAAFSALNALTVCLSSSDIQATSTNNSCHIDDLWVTSNTDCGTRTQPTAGTTFDGTSACLNIHDWVSTQVTNRYNLELSAYPSVLDQIQSAWHTTAGLVGLKAEMTTAIANWQSKVTAVNTLLASYQTDLTSLQSVLSGVVKSTTDNLLSCVNKVMNSTNCAFIGNNYNQFYTGVCDRMVPDLLLVSLCLALSCLCNVALTLCAVVLVRRLKIERSLQVAPLSSSPKGSKSGSTSPRMMKTNTFTNLTPQVAFGEDPTGNPGPSSLYKRQGSSRTTQETNSHTNTPMNRSGGNFDWSQSQNSLQQQMYPIHEVNSRPNTAQMPSNAYGLYSNAPAPAQEFAVMTDAAGNPQSIVTITTTPIHQSTGSYPDPSPSHFQQYPLHAVSPSNAEYVNQLNSVAQELNPSMSPSSGH
eukprot:GILK01003832.1.p1 GENE.GILK01003832.1~~GILK01003832.1.p1  ORF type:complete len:971 (+),score=121.91 GILK01003832.1:39-2915(+)